MRKHYYLEFSKQHVTDLTTITQLQLPPRQEGGYTTKIQRPNPWLAADPGDQHPNKNLSDTSPFHSRRQELPEDLPTQTPTPEY
jgi:hypothetical protein